MEPHRALIIEDDPATARLLAYILDDAGYEVTTIDAAVGALGLARRLRPDVILLDLGLPYRSGAALLAELKAGPATARIPVIVVSGASEVLMGDRAMQAEAVVAKPFSPQVLVDTVDAVCGRAE